MGEAAERLAGEAKEKEAKGKTDEEEGRELLEVSGGCSLITKRKERLLRKTREWVRREGHFFGDRQGGGSGSEAFEGERKLTGKEGRAEEVAFRTFR